MDSHRIGALAAVCSKDGTRLKIVIVGKGGQLLDADCQFLAPDVDPATVPGALLDLPEGDASKITTKWTDGILTEVAFERSAIAGCTLGSSTETPCFFYQGQDASLYMKQAKSDGWTDAAKVIDANAKFPPYQGTALSVHLDEGGDYMYLYYQANRPSFPGEIIGCKLSSGGSITLGEVQLFAKAMPLGTPFVVIYHDSLWSLFYSTENSEFFGEAYGGMKSITNEATGAGSQILKTSYEVLYSSTNPTPFVMPGRYPITPKVTQVAACHFEAPTFYVPAQRIESGSQPTSMPDRVLGAYQTEYATLLGTGVALATHTPQYHLGNAVYVDPTGAVCVGRLSTKVYQDQRGFGKPIPLEKMRTAYAWAVPDPPVLPAPPVLPVSPLLPLPPSLPVPPLVSTPSGPHLVPPNHGPTGPKSRPAPSNSTPVVSNSGSLPIMDPVAFQRDLVQIVSDTVQQEFARRDAQAGIGPALDPSPSSDRKLWAHRGCLETP
ncbi:hypothetical protein BV25DRAFT_781162 [Artomyces pyxidatus]|uniref:Uncharacterized protein n=1 Tax=Artomyces pyxidatus TaxID=48021 RepID=A0ACB8SXP9_9AGAM|nr:hypothetical protein BV25DRAFT_781162 [Artomyces pyxidatus]